MPVLLLHLILGAVGLGMSAFFVRLGTQFPVWGAQITVVGLFVGLITLARPRAGLYILIFSMLLAPAFAFGRLGMRAIEIRMADVLLLLVFVAWFTTMTLRKERMLGFGVPLLKPMSIYVAVACVSSLFALIRGDLKPLMATFFLLKYIQYYMLYYMTYHLVQDFEGSKPLLLAALFTALGVLAFAYFEIVHGRVPYCPFDIDKGIKETATLGGYLMMVCGISGGVALTHPLLRVRVLMGGLILACIPPILLTTSRATYFSSAVMMLAMLLLARRGRMLIVFAALIGFFLVPRLFQKQVEKARTRVAYTFVAAGQEERVQLLGRQVVLESSAAARWRKWRQMWTQWLRDHPFIGHGVSGVGLVDAQIPRVIGEVGLIGFGAWLAIMFGLFSRLRRLQKTVEEPLRQGLVYGFLCLYIALLVQSVAVNTFIIIRLMEPFWFMAAVLMRLQSEQDAETPESRPAVHGPGFRRAVV